MTNRLALPLAVLVLAGCPAPAANKPATPRTAASRAPAVAASILPTPAARRTPAELPEVSFPPVLVPTPPPAPTGVKVTTIAGTRELGWVDGPGATAMLDQPRGLTIGPDENLYFVEAGGRVRMIDLHDPAYPVTSLAGGGTAAPGPTDAPGYSLLLNWPSDLAFLPDGRLAVSLEKGNAVLVLTLGTGSPEAKVRVLAGDGQVGQVDGPGAKARFGPLYGISWVEDKLVAGDTSFNRLRGITPDGLVSTVAGAGPPNGEKAGTSGVFLVDGALETAVFNNAFKAVPFGPGRYYVIDTFNHAIRKVDNGNVTTLAGVSSAGSGHRDGFWRSAYFNTPMSGALDPAGNLVVVDSDNHRLRLVTPLGDVSTLAGPPQGVDAGLGGWADGSGPNARFHRPYGIAIAKDGTIYVADTHNFCIRKVTRT